MPQAFAAGARGFVLKNSDVEEIVAAIRTVNLGAMFICTGVNQKPMTEYLSNEADRDDACFYESLSPRERELLPLIASSQTNDEIAIDVHLSPHTVKTYRQRLMKKLRVHNHVDLLRFALRLRLVPLSR